MILHLALWLGIVLVGNPGALAQETPNQVEPRIVDPFEVLAQREAQRRDGGPILKPVDPFEVARADVASRLESGRPDETCEIDFNMPFPVRRALVFYLLTEDARRCSKAVQEIRGYSAKFGRRAELNLESPAFLADPKNADARALVDRYIGACSYKLNDSTVAQLLDTSHRSLIAKAVGTFSTRNGDCVGTVTGSSILTARHCLGREKDGEIAVEIPETGFNFRSLDGTIELHVPKPNSAPAALPLDQLEKDWIELAFSVPPEIVPKIPVDLKLAARWQPLLLVSVSRYLQALAQEAVASPNNITFDISPLCSILARDGNILFHSCQTLRGMSGSPLLTMSEGRLSVVGVHSGDAEAVETACGRKLSVKYKNYGIIPDGSKPN
jgi:hypothetical protein